jgi:hypothetical protein
VRRERSGALLAGIALILVGGYLLARRFLPNFDVDLVWPVVAIAIGAVLLIASIRPGPR